MSKNYQEFRKREKSNKTLKMLSNNNPFPESYFNISDTQYLGIIKYRESMT